MSQTIIITTDSESFIEYCLPAHFCKGCSGLQTRPRRSFPSRSCRARCARAAACGAAAGSQLTLVTCCQSVFSPVCLAIGQIHIQHGSKALALLAVGHGCRRQPFVLASPGKRWWRRIAKSPHAIGSAASVVTSPLHQAPFATTRWPCLRLLRSQSTIEALPRPPWQRPQPSVWSFTEEANSGKYSVS